MALHPLIKDYDESIGDTSYSWFLFIQDLLPDIRKQSTTIELSAYQKNIYRYRLMELLLDLRLNKAMLPIVLWLNGLRSEQEFNDIELLVIPDAGYLQTLRRYYDNLNKKPDTK